MKRLACGGKTIFRSRKPPGFKIRGEIVETGRTKLQDPETSIPSYMAPAARDLRLGKNPCRNRPHEKVRFTLMQISTCYKNPLDYSAGASKTSIEALKPTRWWEPPQE